MIKLKQWIAVYLMLLLFLFLLPLSALAAPVGKITNLAGNVDITIAGSAARTVALGEPVNVGDFVRTKSKSKVEITFNEGNVLRLAENTRVGITEYMSGVKRNSSLFNLFRGRIQNIVKAVGPSGGRYEVHTPTSVCGVRGTNFFNFYLAGASGSIFQEGTGYGYSKNNPADVKTITAGQGMFVPSATIGAQLRSVSNQQLDEMKHATEISGSSGTSGGTDNNNSSSSGTSGSSTDSSSSSSTSSSSSSSTSSSSTSSTTNSPTVTIPPPVQPVQSNQTSTTTLSLSLSPATNPPFSHVINDTISMTGTTSDSGSTFSVTATGGIYGTVDNPGAGLVSGTIANGSTTISGLSGYMMGLPNESRTGAKALLSTVYVNNDGKAGFLLAPLNATFYANSMTGSGVAYKYSPVATTSLTPATLSLSTLSDISLPEFGNVSIYPSRLEISCGDATCQSEAKGINVNGGKIGVWGGYSIGSASTYSNANAVTSFSSQRYIYYDSTKKAVLYSDSLTGAVDAGAKEVSISGDFLYLSTLYKGALTMNHFAYYDNTDTYKSVSSGTIQLQPMAFADVLSGSLSGVVGSASSIWSNTSVPVTMMGTYSVASGYNMILSNWISSNYLLGTGTLTNDVGGSYRGYANTVIQNPPGSGTGIIYSDILGLYADTSGNIGILNSSVPGSVYSEQTGFKADGQLNRITMAELTPIKASNSSLFGITESSYTATSSVNYAYGGPNITLSTLTPVELAITGYLNWNIEKAVMDGTYDVSTSPYSPLGDIHYSYDRKSGGNVVGWESFYVTESPTTAAWSSADGGYFRGDVAGASTDWQSATTSVFGGKIIGTFSATAGASGTWSATALLTRIETADFITMADNAAGRQKLADLNIPSVQVGSVDLSGNASNGNTIDVSLQGVKFYAYSAGQAPKIFATGSVSGTYSSGYGGGSAPMPTVTLSANNLSNVSSMSAVFTPGIWDYSSTGKWAAKLTGSGAMQSPSTGFIINGGAAGKLNGGSGGTTGTFTGTASGTVRPATF